MKKSAYTTQNHQWRHRKLVAFFALFSLFFTGNPLLVSSTQVMVPQTEWVANPALVSSPLILELSDQDSPIDELKSISLKFSSIDYATRIFSQLHEVLFANWCREKLDYLRIAHFYRNKIPSNTSTEVPSSLKI